jgi:hypothetical protein
MIEAVRTRFIAPHAIRRQAVRNLEEGIRSELEFLSSEGLQSSYSREAKYVYANWLGYIAMYSSGRRLPEYVIWAIAGDMAAKFPYHTYEEWARVFGAPLNHPVIRQNISDPDAVSRRRHLAAQVVNTKRAAFVWHCWSLVAILIVLSTTVYGLLYDEPITAGIGAIVVAILVFGYSSVLDSMKNEVEKARGFLMASDKSLN